METLNAIYDKGLKNNCYVSTAYQMITEFTPMYRELEKCLYIKDLEQKNERLKELLNGNKQGTFFVRHNRNPYKSAEDLGITEQEYRSWKRQKMMKNANIWDIERRATALFCYTNKILKRAEDILKKTGNTYTAICYLIDERFKWHGNIFNNKIENYFFSEECTHFVFDVLQLKEVELSKLERPPLEDFTLPTKKPITWNSKKKILGTLFGVLQQNGVISGTTTDIAKALAVLFEGESSTTLQKSIYLNPITDMETTKVFHDEQTVKMLASWIKYCKDNLKK